MWYKLLHYMPYLCIATHGQISHVDWTWIYIYVILIERKNGLNLLHFLCFLIHTQQWGFVCRCITYILSKYTSKVNFSDDKQVTGPSHLRRRNSQLCHRCLRPSVYLTVPIVALPGRCIFEASVCSRKLFGWSSRKTSPLTEEPLSFLGHNKCI